MKRLLSVLLALVMTLGLLATTAWADDTHTHCVCGGNYTGTGHTHDTSAEWTAWTKTDSLPSETGNYYLTDNVTVSTGWEITGDIKLCLNGKTLSKDSNGSDFITVKSNGTLTITDCKSGGQVKGGYHIVAVAGGTFNMYGGTITGRRTKACGSVYVPNGTFNMYGGIIIGNETIDRDDHNLGGGGVYNEGTFNMYGGEISGNKSANLGGGGVFNAGAFNMYGGTIKDNTATNNGGGIYNGKNENDSVTFTFTGGTVSGEVFVKSGTTATIAGGLVGNDITTDDSTGSLKTVYFDTQGGSAVASQTLIGADAKAVEPADPTREGYMFVGWVNNDGSDYNFDAVVTRSLTLTAVWEEIPAPEGHTHIRRQPAATTTADTTVSDTTKADTVTSAKTFDVGSTVYGVMAVAALLGVGYVGKKRG